jgi:7-carboxy-7-deazaguanine synthase
LNKQNTLRITEIFLSLQGETSRTGLPTVFVRLTGCPLRCQYCDTAYAFNGGQVTNLDDILATVEAHATPYVTVTGGEPLAQKNCNLLLTQLCDAGFSVSLETSGAMPLDEVDPRVMIVMDLKTPASAEESKNDYSNLQKLKPEDELKFVICDRADYDWAKNMLIEQQLNERCSVLFSPVADTLSARDLADWIVADHLPVRFQIQLHKLLWNDGPGR